MPASTLHKIHFERDRFASRLIASQTFKLRPQQVDKPWGRTEIPSLFGTARGRIGEICFEHPAANHLPLLVKYIFTSEKLSVQVHPNDEEARQRGLLRGKNECWYILDAEPGASLGLGFRSSLPSSDLCAAALDGSIEHLLDWTPAAPGDFFYVPAGTVHAIGAGIVLLEFQQNSDVTYRLYDYGRPRELHLKDGTAVSNTDRYAEYQALRAGGPVNAVLHNGPDFSLVRVSSTDKIPLSLSTRLRWVMPLEGTVSSRGERASAGECLLLGAGAPLFLSQRALVLIGASGPI